MNLQNPEISQLVWSQIWQVTLVAIAVGAIVRLTCKRRPHLAYFLWMLVLMKAVTPPVWASPVSVFRWSGATDRQVQREDVSHEKLESNSNNHANEETGRKTQGVHHEIAVNTEIGTTSENETQSVSISENAQPATESNSQTSFSVAIVFYVWLSGVLGVIGICIFQCLRFRGLLKRHRVPIPQTLQERIEHLAKQLGIRKRIRLAVVDRPTIPAVFGAFRPTVILPKNLLDELSLEECESIIVHELIHLKRGDSIAGRFQLFVQAIWWFHPLIWWVNRETRRERENCCDADVVRSLACQPAEYARCLVWVLESAQIFRHQAAAIGVSPFDITSKRLEKIMCYSQSTKKPSSFLLGCVLILFTMMILPGSAVSQKLNKKPQKKTTQVLPEEVQKLVKELSDSSFKKRRAAFNKLKAAKEANVNLSKKLKELLGTTKNPELKQQLNRIFASEIQNKKETAYIKQLRKEAKEIQKSLRQNNAGVTLRGWHETERGKFRLTALTLGAGGISVDANSPFFRLNNINGTLVLEYEIPRPKNATDLGIFVKSNLLITQITRGSLAESVGIEAGDLLGEIDGKDINTAKDFEKELVNAIKGEKQLKIAVYRGEIDSAGQRGVTIIGGRGAPGGAGKRGGAGGRGGGGAGVGRVRGLGRILNQQQRAIEQQLSKLKKNSEKKEKKK